MGLDYYLCSSSDPFMQMVQECDARKPHENGTILCGGVFEQAPQTDANISACAAVLIVYSPGAENLCTLSIAISLRNYPWT